MRSRLPSWILLLLLLYVAIDLANPFVPGAFRFTAEEGVVWVEGTSRSREGTKTGLSKVTGLAPPAREVAPDKSTLVSAQPGRAWHLTSWLVRVRTGDPPSRDLPPSDADDH